MNMDFHQGQSLLIFLLILLICPPFSAVAEFFSALGDMQSLVHTQSAFIDRLDSFVASEEDNLARMKKFLAMVEARFGGPQGPPIPSLSSIEGDSASLIGNPINAFLLIKYLSKDWRDLTETMFQDGGSEFITQLKNDTNLVIPDFDDYKGAMTAIMRLQETYKIDAKTFADGNLGRLRAASPMTAADCFNFGRAAYVDQEWILTVAWMKEALSREKLKSVPDSKFVGEILDHLAYATSKTGDFKGALAWAEELGSTNPRHERVQGYLNYFKSKMQESVSTRGRTGDLGDEKVAIRPEATSIFDREYWLERRTYQALCRGDKAALKLTPRRKAKLICKYHHGNKPNLLLSPAKIEVVFDRPRLVVIHDILNEAEIEDVLKTANGRLRRATARNARTGMFEPADYRISKSTWLPPSTSRTVRSIFNRVGDITNLDMEFSEDLQVNNYGIGGMYDPHFDFSRSHEKTFNSAYGDHRGNRIATMLFYLSDVESGGATVFPTVGASVKPIKGSAVFWYNLLPSGEGDLDTRHAGCPVLLGSKWVANFWIHEAGQEFRRKCRTNMNAKR